MLDKKIKRFIVLDEDFAKGNFGEIILAKDPLTNKEVVIKKIQKTIESVTAVHKEIEAGKRLKHSNIVKYIESFQTETHHFIVFEKIDGNDLFSVLEQRKFVPYKENEVRKIFRQVTKAIEHSHKNGIVNRDIKLENILIDKKGRVTVIDFGLCDTVKIEQKSERFCGSVDYVAPEVLAKKSYSGFSADVFSLGVVLYTLLFAQFPFVVSERLSAIASGKKQPDVQFSDQSFVTDSAKELIRKMINPEPTERISLEEVHNHKWMKQLW